MVHPVFTMAKKALLPASILVFCGMVPSMFAEPGAPKDSFARFGEGVLSFGLFILVLALSILVGGWLNARRFR